MIRVPSIVRILFGTLVLCAGPIVRAQQPEQPYRLQEDTSRELAKLPPLLESKSTAPALAIIDAQLAKVPPDGYDAAILLQVKVQFLLQENRLVEAIEPLERCLRISDIHTPRFLQDRVANEFTYYLAQLNFQRATTTKDKQEEAASFRKAESYMERWLKEAHRVTPEPLLFYASLLYNRATESSTTVDEAMLNKALGLVDRAMRFEARPKDNLYVLKLACLLQLTRYSDAAEVLEILLKRQPENGTYWQQLAAIYLNEGQETRAIVTMERAIANGRLNTPKDLLNLVSVYFNAGQYGKAAELLEDGLKRGTLDNTEKTWELLSNCYTQLHLEDKAADALARAAKAFPATGRFDLMIAQSLYSRDRNKEAITHLRQALERGGLASPQQAYQFLAYLLYQAKDFEAALEAADASLGFAQGKEEGVRLKKAIQDAIVAREAARERERPADSNERTDE